ncbi:outer membrane lipoprotein carrier protein LolA [Emticicia oligotrophica DSM 17448]|uniref:Outer membrane lipoprotein carrier protein LolA n=1 Tax=Emticicia oligotrophica (strain DSM 17448 / CIP 109782 / MTCC 6937 / GPTSA100-15) TaxID=929562 RepID=A0ABM5MYT5_EMTOG|nr:outer membrane lipoprotein carrier protein LolA [Emticicia oligotrophica]AFK02257.1 outer membrane lipoprotein carrier protein LolA [Emticicia oligotrophica DSM 17448]
MKKILVLTANLLLVSGLVMAQKDKRATAILDEMSKKYQTMKSFSASFTYGIEGTNAKLTESYKGDVTVKGAKFRLKMAGQEVFTNGKEMYSYVKETNECSVTEFNPNEMDALSPTKIYTIYKKGYKYVFLEEVKEGSQFYEVVELSPEDKTSKVAKVQIKVDKKDKSVKSWKVWDKNGKRTVFRVDKFMPNAPADDKFFTFDKKKYPGVEVVDLR